MPEKEWGKRRVCPACGIKYYDMNRQPILCPRCATPYRKEFGTKRQKAAMREKVSETVMDIEPEITAITAADEGSNADGGPEDITLPDTADDPDDLLPEETESPDLSPDLANIPNPNPKTMDQ